MLQCELALSVHGTNEQAAVDSRDDVAEHDGLGGELGVEADE